MNYKYLGEIDISSIHIDSCDWDNEYTQSRQNAFEKVHNNVSVIPLMWSFESLNLPMNIPAERTRFYKKYYDPKFFGELFSMLNIGYPIRIIYTKLHPNSEIPIHVDGGESLLYNQRLHIPIETNEEVSFIVGGERKNLPKGSIFEVNNQKTHSVINNSNEDRIHLIVDWHAVEGR